MKGANVWDKREEGWLFEEPLWTAPVWSKTDPRPPVVIRDPTISADCFRRLLKDYMFARYYSAFSALEVLDDNRATYLLTYFYYSTVSLVPPISTMDVWRGKRSINLTGPFKREILSTVTAAVSCVGGISVLNHCLSWSKFVNARLSHSRQWFNIHVFN